MKSILFNTEMVRSTLEDRKTVTRRCIKPKYNNTHFEYRTDKYGTQFVEMQNDEEGIIYGTHGDGTRWRAIKGFLVPKPKYKTGDILYVRETWSTHYSHENNGQLMYCYKADNIDLKAECLPGETNRWYPSIHMPKEASRLFLRVTGVRVEMLQDITEEQALKEGIREYTKDYKVIKYAVNETMFAWSDMPRTAVESFSHLWNSTIKKKELDQYGWNANPYVWVYEFEKISKEEAYERAEI